MKVFISHSSSDKGFVRTLKDDLNANGINTWLDEDELRLGDKLIHKLLGAIDTTTHFIIILSQESINSKWVKLELQRAISYEKLGFIKKIIPIKWRPCNVPYPLAELIHADLSKEQVKVDGNKVQFLSSGYNSFLQSVVTTLRENTLNDQDKTEVKQLLLPEVEDTTRIMRSFGFGSFYRNNTPDSPFLSEVGDKVKVGQELYILECPEKIYNLVESEYDGTILKFFPKNGASVAYEDPLVLIDVKNYEIEKFNTYPRIWAGRFKLLSLSENAVLTYSVVSTVDGKVSFSLAPHYETLVKEKEFVIVGQEIVRVETPSKNIVLISSVYGKIIEFKVREDQNVKRGDVLMLIENVPNNQ